MADRDLVVPGDPLYFASHALRTVIGARVTEGDAKALIRYCSANACSQSEAIRRALAHLGGAGKTRLVTASANAGDLDKVARTVAKALGLSPTASADELTAALKDLIASLAAEPAAPAGESADPPPAPVTAAVAEAEALRVAATQGPKAWAAARAKQRARQRADRARLRAERPSK